MACTRPKSYPEHPQTLGEHLRRARALSGQKQAQVAELIGVNEWTYLLWESDRTEPTARYWPALIRLLGYDPNPPPTSWNEKIKVKRRALGLTVKEAAKSIGVDEGTFSKWERGLARPHVQKSKLKKFFA